MKNDPKLVHIDISGFEHNVIYFESGERYKMEPNEREEVVM